MVIDHIGIVVRSLTEGIEQWARLFGYRQSSDAIFNSRQRVRVVFLAKTESLMVKLIEPSDPESPVFAFARKGGGLHHLCFRCDELQSQIGVMQKRGAVLMVPPQPGEAFNNNEIAFLMAKGNLNIELIATEEKAGLSTDLNG